jgi:hypothetical protein
MHFTDREKSEPALITMARLSQDGRFAGRGLREVVACWGNCQSGASAVPRSRSTRYDSAGILLKVFLGALMLVTILVLAQVVR